MLSYFRVENYKCLERVEFPLTPIHVLIGPNDCGKTSVLEAMLTYMRCTDSNRPVQHYLLGPLGGELVYHGAPKGGKISFAAMSDLALARSENGSPRHLGGYTFSLSSLPKGWEVSNERVLKRADVGPRIGPEHASPMPIPIGTAKGPNITIPAYVRNNGGDPEENLKLPRGMFGPASIYRFDPRLLAVPTVADVARKFRMDPDGFGLASLLDDIVGYDAELFLNLRKSFVEFFPQFKSVRVETATAFQRHYPNQAVEVFADPIKEVLVSSGIPGKEVLFETRWGGTVHARQASDGALLFLAFLALVHLPATHRPKLLLLEEPEKGVYPMKLRELIEALKKWVNAAGENAPQIVMATHSPYLLSFFGPEEVTFLSRTKEGGVRARPLRDAPNIHERLAGGYYLGELWYNLTEEELFGDATA